MDLLSLQYILFIGALLAAFYGLPAIRESLRRFQWILLLAASLLMYWQSGKACAAFSGFCCWRPAFSCTGKPAVSIFCSSC